MRIPPSFVPRSGLAKRSFVKFWPATLFGGVALLFFWPVTFGRGFIPRAGGDLASFLWPTYAYAAQSLRAGRVPLWNPSLYSGYPFLADNQTAVFYPVNLLAFAVSAPLSYRAVEWLVVFHFWLAGVGMYLLASSLIQWGQAPTTDGRLSSTVGGLLAGLAYMLSDVFVTHVGNLNIVAVAAWLPWVIWAEATALRLRSSRWASIAGAILATAVLAGHAQMALMLVGTLASFGLWHLAVEGGRGKTLALLAVTAVVGFGLSALSVLPAAELVGYTARARLSYDEAARYSLPWPGLAGIISPLLFGRGAAAFWAPWERVETGFLGTIPLLLFGLAPLRRDRRAQFFAALGLIGLLIALGEHTPVHRWLYTLLPGFSQLRVPARFVLLLDFSLALLAAWGLAEMVREAVTRARVLRWTALVTLVGATTLALAYFVVTPSPGGEAHVGSLRLALTTFAVALCAWLGLLFLWGTGKTRAIWSGTLVTFLAAELLVLGAFVEVDSNDPTQGFYHSRAAQFLRSQPGPTRIDNASAEWQPDTALLAGLEDIGGIYNPLAIAAYEAYYWSVGHRGSPQYNFLNAQFVVADKGRPPADATFVPVYNDDPKVDIYLNTNAMPRLSLVYSARRVPDARAAFDVVHAADFDPATTVVVEGTEAPEGADAAPDGQAALYYLDYAPGVQTVVARVPAPAYLVFAEVWYPGWRAWVDGKEAPIFRANSAFRAIYMPSEGEHTVVMRFDPLSWKVGLGITSATVVLLSVFLLVFRQPEAG